MVAAVVGDRDTAARVFSRLFDVISDSLRRAADRELVHPVRARTADAAKSGGPENYFLIETVRDLGVIAADRFQFPVHIAALRQLLKPKLIGFRCTHRCCHRIHPAFLIADFYSVYL